MMKHIVLHKTLSIFIASVWIVNGLFCKLLDLVPRHRQIVGSILGDDQAVFFTQVIGILELLMAAWILSRIKPQLCAIVQILVVAAMNAIEFFLVPEMLLFGRANSIVAIVFIGFIYFNEFVLNKKPAQPA
ncbi:MAG: DoxX-like family protein [Bacteroidota bacterium]